MKQYDIFISQIWDSSDFSASMGSFQHQTWGSNHSISDHLAGDGLEVKGVEHRVERPRSAASGFNRIPPGIDNIA